MLTLVAMLVTLLLALFLISGVQQDSLGTRIAFLDDNYVWVLVVTVLALVVLLWTIAPPLDHSPAAGSSRRTRCPAGRPLG